MPTSRLIWVAERGTTGAFWGLKETAGGRILLFCEQPQNARTAHTARRPVHKDLCSMRLF